MFELALPVAAKTNRSIDRSMHAMTSFVTRGQPVPIQVAPPQKTMPGQVFMAGTIPRVGGRAKLREYCLDLRQGSTPKS